ncbi:MAG: hypothetical protein GXP24_13175 [Planctomycetes bacterium]|nr:hypothetical protein [Planctomycetota bacterium]
MYPPLNKNRTGLSLIEVVVSSLLVGTVVVGSLSMLGASVRTQTTANALIHGPLLADMLLAEIMSMPYEDPEDGGGSIGTDSGESNGNRADFDDVDDFNGWSPSDVEDRLGNEFNEYSGWTRSSSVNRADRMSGNWWFAETGLKRIIVTVTAPDGTVTQRYGWRSRDGSLQQPPTVDKTVVTQIEATLSVGSASAMRGTTNLLNHVEAPNP